MPQLQLVADLAGHVDPAWCVAFNPSRSLLASCSTDKTVRLYSYTLPQPETHDTTLPSPNAPRPQLCLVTSIPTDHKRTVRSIAWAPGGRTLATASFDSTVGVWEEVEPMDEEAEGVYRPESEGGGEREWECVTTLEGHESECKSVGFSFDGALLASCSRDKSVWVWEVQPDADFECISVMMEHSQDVKCIAWHPREEILASASYDSHIHLMFDDPDGDWSPFQKLHPKLPAADLVIPLDGAPGLVAAMSPSASEKAAQLGLEIPPLVEDETVWSLAWSPCGRYLASGGDLGGVRLWARTGSQPDSAFVEVLHTSAHGQPCFSLSWGLGGTDSESGGLGLLASAGGDERIIIWQVSVGTGAVVDGPAAPRPTLQPIAAVRDAHGVSDVNSVAWCVRDDGRGREILASAGDDGSVKVWRVVGDV